MGGEAGPTISENSFKYDSTNKRLEAVITDNLSGVKDVLFTQKETVDETDWSTASQYYEKDTASDKYYSKNITITSRNLVFIRARRKLLLEFLQNRDFCNL